MCTEVVYSRCMSGEAEVSSRARLMLRSYNHIECIPVEGQNSGTCLVVACIRLVVFLMCKADLVLDPDICCPRGYWSSSFFVAKRCCVVVGGEERREDFDCGSL